MEKTILEELNRYKSINGYVNRLINEQVPPTEDPTMGGEIPALPPPEPSLGDVPPLPPSTDMGPDIPPDTEKEPKVDPEADDTTEELDITDLVDMTKNIKNQLDATKDDSANVIQKMDGLFNKLSELEAKLSEMDSVILKIDQLGGEIQDIKPKTPQEKLEMRSLDSYPFNQKPNDFFNEKQQEMRASGKNEYVLTKNDVENYGQSQIMKSFNGNNESDNFRY